MDEFLYDRIKQLKDIDDRLHMMQVAKPAAIPEAIRALRSDLVLMIQAAEDAYAAF